VMPVVSVYTNGRTVQDNMFTGQPVNPIGIHKGRFKAKSYLSYAEIFHCTLSHVSFVSRVGFSQFHSCGGLLEKMEF
jgi:hypothetical protein